MNVSELALCTKHTYFYFSFFQNSIQNGSNDMSLANGGLEEEWRGGVQAELKIRI